MFKAARERFVVLLVLSLPNTLRFNERLGLLSCGRDVLTVLCISCWYFYQKKKIFSYAYDGLQLLARE